MTMIPAGALIRNREVPELGSGRVLAELEGDAARVVFENSEEVREVRLQHADIVRQPLIPGMLVEVQLGDEVQQGEIVDVDWPDSPRELCAYTVRVDGSDEPLFESQVTPVSPASSDPLEQLSALRWRGPFRFFSRWDMHRMISRWYEDSEGLSTTIGARIVPQIQHAHGVRHALWATRARHLLADQDPQARLYQAGMVVQSMYADRPDLRVLVVTSGRRSYRWKSDLELRFGGRDWMRVDAGHLEANPPERWASIRHNDRLIVSVSCLQRHPEAFHEVLASAHWDLLIIDEAHTLDAYDPAYRGLRTLSMETKDVLVLGAMPSRADADDLVGQLGLLRPEEFDPHRPEVVSDRIEQLEDVWQALARADELIEAEDKDSADVEAVIDGLEGLAEDDAFVAERCAEIDDGDHDALGQLVGYLRSYYRLDPNMIRCRREQMVEFGSSFNERSVERVDYTPDDAEAVLVEQLSKLAEPEDALQLALRGLYQRAVTSPDRFFMLLEQRLEALETTAGRDDPGLDPSLLLGTDPSPTEEEMLEDLVIAGAAGLGEEGAWIAEAMSIVGQWHADAEVGCARFEAAGDWIEAFLAERDAQRADEDEPMPLSRVLVACSSRQLAQEASFFLESRLSAKAVALLDSGMSTEDQNDAAELFRRDIECRVLVCDEVGAAGRDLSRAEAIVHLDQPRSTRRVQRRVGWLDKQHRSLHASVHSVVLVGPSPVEQALVDLYDARLGLYEQAGLDKEFELAVADRRLWQQVARGEVGFEQYPDALGEPDDEQARRDCAWQGSLDAPRAELDEDAEFAELLDFIDGLADSLPVRHWARMLGLQDHSASTNVYDFKWHWSNVRRPLIGFDTDPDEVDFLLPQEQVGMMSGTFSRKRALRNENLEFFAPGHKLIDALVADALAPTDGRASIFARRLSPQHRGKMFVNVVALSGLQREAWGEVDMPPGLVRRAYRHLWPESVSVPVQIDLRAEATPSIVEDWDLVQKIEQSYQGPEADQKIEYEILLQAIEDAGRFRRMLGEAVELAMDHMREERSGLVEGAAQELAADLDAEMSFLSSLAARGDDPRALRAEVELTRRKKLIESARQETLSLDALAIVIGGTPQILLG